MGDYLSFHSPPEPPCEGGACTITVNIPHPTPPQLLPTTRYPRITHPRIIMAKDRNNVIEAVRQSPPLDMGPYDPSGVSGKTIIITGGASGFGEGFARNWAAHGANVIIADISNGQPLADELRKAGGTAHYVRCDVTNWQSQVDMFREAVKLSPRGTIDAVVLVVGKIPDSRPSRCRKLNCVPVWGIVQIEQRLRCIIDRCVWKVTITSA